ncbi:MAG: hypothetical protein KAT04_08650 [Methylococcales bacterium]|nr:hypothetical protein [Methylococcales bacterium]
MPSELACDFYSVFSRIEYALKSTEFAIGNNKRVEPAWDKFANEIDEKLFQSKDKKLLKAIEYILQNPPRKQVLENGRIAFINQTIDDSQKRTQQLLLMIRTIRNNLFHGGKYLPGGEVEAGRNELLVKYSMNILLRCIQINKNVYASYQH